MKKLLYLFFLISTAQAQTLTGTIPSDGLRAWVTKSPSVDGINFMLTNTDATASPVASYGGIFNNAYDAFIEIPASLNATITGIDYALTNGDFTTRVLNWYSVAANGTETLLYSNNASSVARNTNVHITVPSTTPRKIRLHIINNNYPTYIHFTGTYTNVSFPLLKPATNYPLINQFGFNGFVYSFEAPTNPNVPDPARVAVNKNFKGNTRIYQDRYFIQLDNSYVWMPDYTKFGGFSLQKAVQSSHDNGNFTIVCYQALDSLQASTYNGHNPTNTRELPPCNYGDDKYNPYSYRKDRDLVVQTVIRFGHNQNIPDSMVHYDPTPAGSYPNAPVSKFAKGLGIMDAIEPGNEQDKYWKDTVAHQNGAQIAANMSMIYDGHMHQYGIGGKDIDSTMIFMYPGVADWATDQFWQARDWVIKYRGYKPNGKINWPWDEIPYHQYFSNAQQYSGATGGNSPEKALPQNFQTKVALWNDFMQREMDGMPYMCGETGYDKYTGLNGILKPTTAGLTQGVYSNVLIGSSGGATGATGYFRVDATGHVDSISFYQHKRGSEYLTSDQYVIQKSDLNSGSGTITGAITSVADSYTAYRIGSKSSEIVGADWTLRYCLLASSKGQQGTANYIHQDDSSGSYTLDYASMGFVTSSLQPYANLRYISQVGALLGGAIFDSALSDGTADKFIYRYKNGTRSYYAFWNGTQTGASSSISITLPKDTTVTVYTPSAGANMTTQSVSTSSKVLSLTARETPQFFSINNAPVVQSDTTYKTIHVQHDTLETTIKPDSIYIKGYKSDTTYGGFSYFFYRLFGTNPTIKNIKVTPLFDTVLAHPYTFTCQLCASHDSAIIILTPKPTQAINGMFPNNGGSLYQRTNLTSSTGSNAFRDNFQAGKDSWIVQTLEAANLTDLLTYNYPPCCTGAYYPTGSALTAAAYSLDSVLSANSGHLPKIISLNNEELNTNYWKGTVSDYTNWFMVAANIIHKYNIPISNGGFLHNIIYYVREQYRAEGNIDTVNLINQLGASLPKFIQTNTTGVQSIVNAYAQEILALVFAGINKFNIHWYEPMFGSSVNATQTIGFLKIIIKYLQTHYPGIEIIITEFGTGTDSQTLFNALANEINNAGIKIRVYYAGNGPLSKYHPEFWAAWIAAHPN